MVENAILNSKRLILIQKSGEKWHAKHDVFMNKMLTMKNEISCQLRQLSE
jgi:hypothetical protein